MICGPWQCMYEIGHGAYGTVYLAERRDGERVAVKLCRRDAVGDKRYARELRGAKLYGISRDSLYQIRKRLTVKLRETVTAVLSEMDAPIGI